MTLKVAADQTEPFWEASHDDTLTVGSCDLTLLSHLGDLDGSQCSQNSFSLLYFTCLTLINSEDAAETRVNFKNVGSGCFNPHRYALVLKRG